jgi:hypothetical protein
VVKTGCNSVFIEVFFYETKKFKGMDRHQSLVFVLSANNEEMYLLLGKKSVIIVDRYGELENQTLLKEMASWTAGAKVRIPLLYI